MSETPDETPDDVGGRPPPTDDIDDIDDDEEYDDEHVYDLTGRRRFLSGGRLAVIGVVALLLVGGGVLLALGGSEGDASSDGGGAEGEAAMEDAVYEYAECMREQGIDMPDPQVADDGGVVIQGGPEHGTGDSPSVEEMEAAEEACGHILEDAEPDDLPQLTPEEIAERQDQVLALARCMRDRGWDYPDPEVGEDGGIQVRMDEDSGVPLPGDPDHEEFAQDEEECHEEAGIPVPPGGGGLNTGGVDVDGPGTDGEG